MLKGARHSRLVSIRCCATKASSMKVYKLLYNVYGLKKNLNIREQAYYNTAKRMQCYRPIMYCGRRFASYKGTLAKSLKYKRWWRD